jgi:release factor glutamine methyltransferase
LVHLTVEYFNRKGIANPRLDAEVLLAHVLGVSRLQLYLDFDKPLESPEVGAFREAVRRRARHEPVAYITGDREFWSLPLAVDSRVLVPRPETETLVQACLPRMTEDGRLADLGTGSGAVALALLAERPGWVGVGVDRSAGALAVADENVRRTGFQGRLELRQGDLFSPLNDEVFHLVVSNPPYIPTAEVPQLEPEVSQYEPTEALDGGVDGLDVIRAIAQGAVDHLARGGSVAVEFGAGQADQVAAIFESVTAYRDVELMRDYAGHPRVVVARKR